MKNFFKTYIVTWILALFVFNAIAFQVVDLSNVGKNYWIGYAFISLSFFVNLTISVTLKKANNANKSFLNLSVCYIAFVSLIVSVIVGLVTIISVTTPWWVGFIINAIVLVAYLSAILGGNAATDVIEEVDEKVKVQTQFIKSLTVDAQGLISRAQNDEAKSSATRVYEAIRYSDTMSVDALSGVEQEIISKFDEYSNAVVNNLDSIKEVEDELLTLVSDRNNKCKALK